MQSLMILTGSVVNILLKGALLMLTVNFVCRESLLSLWQASAIVQTWELLNINVHNRYNTDPVHCVQVDFLNNGVGFLIVYFLYRIGGI